MKFLSNAHSLDQNIFHKTTLSSLWRTCTRIDNYRLFQYMTMSSLLESFTLIETIYNEPAI